jgi:metallo-beta-lactamase class B
VVAYFPTDQVLFGGCLIKEVGATVGYLGDANTSAWSETVTRVKANFPKVKTVIPGHGKVGGVDLLDYTIRLFEDK